MKQIAVLLLLAFTLPVVACAESLPLATGEWSPYTSEALEGYGFITEIITEVLTYKIRSDSAIILNS